MELTDNKGADAVIDFVNASKTVEADMQLLRRRAKVVLVGLFGGELKLNLVSMPTRAYSINWFIYWKYTGYGRIGFTCKEKSNQTSYFR